MAHQNPGGNVPVHNANEEEDVLSFINALPPLDVGFPELMVQPADQRQDDVNLANPEALPEIPGNPPARNPYVVPIRRDGRRANRYPPLSLEVLSQYFLKPIHQAAAELEVGETFVKEQCRKAGLRQWPYYKFKCLDTVRTGFDGREAGAIPAGAQELLESEQRKLQDNPNLPLDPRIYKYRNSIYKYNHNKRRKLGEGSSNTPIPVADEQRSSTDEEEEEEERTKPVSEFYIL